MSTTRERLLDEAERLFARSSIPGVTTRQIVEAAQQRNTSAVTYHFGSRGGLLLELLARRGGPVDQHARVALDPDGAFSVAYPAEGTAYNVTAGDRGITADLLAGDGGTFRR